MLKLFKYEFLRRKRLLLGVLLTIIFLEAAVLLGIKLGNNYIIMSIVLFLIIWIGGILFPFIEAVANYFSDFKKNQGYMLFLTPNKGIKIFGAKALFVLMEIVAIVLILWGVIAINWSFLSNIFPEQMANVSSQLIEGIKMALAIEKISFVTILPLLLLTMIQYFTNIMIALLGITIAKTLLSNKDFNWVFTLLFYFGVAAVVQVVNFLMLIAFGFAGDVVSSIQAGGDTMPNIIKYLFVGAGVYLIWSFASIFISSKLLDKRTDL